MNGSLTRLVGNNMDIFFHYSADGHIAQVVNHDASLLWSYDYNATMDGVPFIMQYGYTRPGEEVHSFADDEPSFERLSMLNAEGLICRDNNRNTFMWSTGENFDYEYKDGGMIRMSGSDGIVVNLSWMDGNLTAISFFENKEEVGRITCSYSTIPAKGLLPTIFSPLAFLLNYYTIQSYGPLSEGFYGCLGNYLLSGMTVSFTEEFKKKHSPYNVFSSEYYPIVERQSRQFSYETDADGNAIRVVIDEGGIVTAYDTECVNTSAVAGLLHSSRRDSISYSIHGRRLTAAPGKGVYIRDGRKVVVK